MIIHRSFEDCVIFYQDWEFGLLNIYPVGQNNNYFACFASIYTGGIHFFGKSVKLQLHEASLLRR